jgi:hypothetical protein
VWVTLFNFVLLNLFAFVCAFQFALDGQSIVEKEKMRPMQGTTQAMKGFHDVLKSLQRAPNRRNIIRTGDSVWNTTRTSELFFKQKNII